MALRRALLRPGLLRIGSAARSPRCAFPVPDNVSILLVGGGGAEREKEWNRVKGSNFIWQSRNFSAGKLSSNKSESVKVPIPVYGVAGKYASSLYTVAVKENALDAVYGELEKLMSAADKSPTFQEFLKDVSVPNKTKIKVVQDIFKGLKFSDITVNFLALLAENHRLHRLKEIYNVMSELMLAHRKIVRATVISVSGLPPKDLEELKKILKRFVKPDETILLDQKTNKRIIGGFMVEIGDKLIDLSVATRLKEMVKVLMEPLPEHLA